MLKNYPKFQKFLKDQKNLENRCQVWYNISMVNGRHIKGGHILACPLFINKYLCIEAKYDWTTFGQVGSQSKPITDAKFMC